MQKKRQVWSMIIAYPQFHAGRSPRVDPCSNQTLIQFHAAQAPGFIHAQPKFSVRFMQQNPQVWWSMFSLYSQFHASKIPRFGDPCSTQTLSQFHAAESPGLMIHALPRLPVSCTRSPRFDPCSSPAVTALYYAVTWALTGKVDQMLGLNKFLFIYRNRKFNK